MTSRLKDERAGAALDPHAAEVSVFVDANAFIQPRDLKDVDLRGLLGEAIRAAVEVD